MISLILVSLAVSPASAYWIWTPKSGKFINPKNAVKPTPKEQLILPRSYELELTKRPSVNSRRCSRRIRKPLSLGKSVLSGLIEEKQVISMSVPRLSEGGGLNTLSPSDPGDHRAEYKLESDLCPERNASLGVSLPVRIRHRDIQ